MYPYVLTYVLKNCIQFLKMQSGLFIFSLEHLVYLLILTIITDIFGLKFPIFLLLIFCLFCLFYFTISVFPFVHRFKKKLFHFTLGSYILAWQLYISLQFLQGLPQRLLHIPITFQSRTLIGFFTFFSDNARNLNFNPIYVLPT